MTQINLPDDLSERIRRHASHHPGDTEVDIIRRALDSLDWQQNERAAIQEGLDAVAQGHARDFHEFDDEFRRRHGLAPEA
ncbi:MAG: hypothetical protein AB7O59_03440 [Pirellulales bacterium]